MACLIAMVQPTVSAITVHVTKAEVAIVTLRFVTAVNMKYYVYSKMFVKCSLLWRQYCWLWPNSNALYICIVIYLYCCFVFFVILYTIIISECFLGVKKMCYCNLAFLLYFFIQWFIALVALRKNNTQSFLNVDLSQDLEETYE